MFKTCIIYKKSIFNFIKMSYWFNCFNQAWICKNNSIFFLNSDFWDVFCNLCFASLFCCPCSLRAASRVLPSVCAVPYGCQVGWMPVHFPRVTGFNSGQKFRGPCDRETTGRSSKSIKHPKGWQHCLCRSAKCPERIIEQRIANLKIVPETSVDDRCFQNCAWFGSFRSQLEQYIKSRGSGAGGWRTTAPTTKKCQGSVPTNQPQQQRFFPATTKKWRVQE